MVGVVFAALLGSHPVTRGLRVAVVDRQELSGQQADRSAVPDLRVSTITPASADALKRIGAWSSLMPPTSAAFSSMQVWDAAGQAHIRYEADDVGQDAIAHVVENSRLVAAVVAQLQCGALYHLPAGNQLASRGGVTLLAPKSLASLELPSAADPRQSASLAQLAFDDGSSISARLVVGADGARSRVRDAAGLRTVGWEYGRRGLVATVATLEPNVTAWQRFLPAGPLALLPVRDGYSNIVWSTTPSQAKELEGLTPEHFAAAVNSALGQGEPPPQLPPLAQAAAAWLPWSAPEAAPFQAPPVVTGWRGSAPRSFLLHLRHAGRYVRPRVALVGDAAHAVHPLAGQGVNLGIADAVALADAVAAAVESGADVGNEGFLAGAYELPRQRANVAMIAALESLGHVFAPQSGAIASIRSAGLAMLNTSGPAKQQIMRYAMG